MANAKRPNQKQPAQGPSRSREDHQGRPQQRDDLPKQKERTKVARDQHAHNAPGNSGIDAGRQGVRLRRD